jgi:hypothetical protein
VLGWRGSKAVASAGVWQMMLADVGGVVCWVAAVLAAVTGAWPALGRRDLERLRPGVDEALTELNEHQLVKHLTDNTGGVNNPARVLAARLANLPLPAAQSTPALPPWCGQCASAAYRWLQDDDGQPVRPCPTCSPQAVKARRNRGAS